MECRQREIMCTVYAQCFCNILGFLKIKFIVGKMYGIMLQTQQRISRIMLQRGYILKKIAN